MKGDLGSAMIPVADAKNLALSKLISPNLALLIQKFASWEEQEKSSSWRMTHYSRQYKEILQEAYPKGYSSFSGRSVSIFNEILKTYRQKYKDNLRKCKGELYVYRLKSRLVTGLGSADVREVGFTFHRYGFPYIPSSTLKGAARAAAELIEGAPSEEIQKIFGMAPEPYQGVEKGQSGQVIFWDAIPLPDQKQGLLELDVMNPHFPTYYRTEGKEPPAEWDSPIPLYFLAVPAGAEFLFRIEGESALRAKAQKWLDLALTQLGIGAKTTLGYGLWVRVI